MLVTGTRKIGYTWTCFKAPHHWLYVHTTWEGSGTAQERLGDKKWYRFDRYVYPFAIWTGHEVWVG